MAQVRALRLGQGRGVQGQTFGSRFVGQRRMSARTNRFGSGKNVRRSDHKRRSKGGKERPKERRKEGKEGKGEGKK